jgi:signal transduction histidine kinase
MIFSNLSIGKRFFLGLIIISLVGASFGLYFSLQIKKVSVIMEKDVPKSVEELKKTSILDANAQFIRYYDEVLTQSARNYAFTSDVKWKDRYETTVPELDKIIKQAMTEGDAQDRLFFDYINISYLALVDMEVKSIALVDAGRSKEAVAILESQAYADQKKLYEEGLRNYIAKRGAGYDQSLEASTQILDKVNKDVQNIVNKTYQLMLVFGVFTALLIVGINFLVLRSVSIPLKRLSDTAKDISEGNISKRITSTSKDEIGQLSVSFNEMLDKLQESRQGLDKKVEEATNEVYAKLKLIEGQKKEMEDNRNATLNLLEDSKALEDELMIEKKGIEKKVVERTKELLEEKTKLTASIESLNKGYLLLDTKENLLMKNQKACALIGSTKSDCSFEDIKAKFKPAYDILRTYKDCISIGKPIDVKEVFLETRYYEFHFSPVISEKIIIGALILIDDITERKIIDRSRDEFFSIASHELRTPLTAIRGNTSMIEDYYAKDIKNPDMKSMLDDIHDSSVRLIKIVNDFLNVSRLEMGKIEFKKSSFDLYTLINAATKELNQVAEEKNLKLETFKPEKDIKIVADADRLKEVLINLIGNSMKYTDKGKVSVSFKKGVDNVEIFVADTGRGISAENQTLLFHKFQQAGSSIFTRDTSKSTGLGLYISKLMIEGMGGSIKLVSSEEGKGSVFSVTLPLA